MHIVYKLWDDPEDKAFNILFPVEDWLEKEYNIILYDTIYGPFLAKELTDKEYPLYKIKNLFEIFQYELTEIGAKYDLIELTPDERGNMEISLYNFGDD